MCSLCSGTSHKTPLHSAIHWLMWGVLNDARLHFNYFSLFLRFWSFFLYSFVVSLCIKVSALWTVWCKFCIHLSMNYLMVSCIKRFIPIVSKKTMAWHEAEAQIVMWSGYIGTFYTRYRCTHIAGSSTTSGEVSSPLVYTQCRTHRNIY